MREQKGMVKTEAHFFLWDLFHVVNFNMERRQKTDWSSNDEVCVNELDIGGTRALNGVL